MWQNPKAEELNKKLLSYLEARDSRALDVIAELKKIGMESDDNALIGYAYYRYAYYYYFTAADVSAFRKNLQIAISYLLRSDNKEYLGGAYNLVAYDAQDQGSFDIAYAYFMIALKTLEGEEGISLPGLIESSAGRLLLELGNYKEGRRQLERAVKNIEPFTDMYVYNYNMIISYADVALASFLMGDARGVSDALDIIDSYYQKAKDEEKELSKTYYLLSHVYDALLSRNSKKLDEVLSKLYTQWKDFESRDFTGLIFEIEAVLTHMLNSGYLKDAETFLEYTAATANDENASVAIRYYTLKILYYEKIGDREKLRDSLRSQHEFKKKLDAEATRMTRYSMEFADMIEEISRERERARAENYELQLMANTDSLTGLPNRNAMNSMLSIKYETAVDRGIEFGIGIIDVDRFKEYNDSYGHQEGDTCLKHIGAALSEFNMRPDLFCTRYGGDEFVVGYFGLKEETIREIAQDMKVKTEKAISDLTHGNKDRITISQGIYNDIPDGTKKLWDYLTLADQELYRIKKGEDGK